LKKGIRGSLPGHPKQTGTKNEQYHIAAGGLYNFLSCKPAGGLSILDLCCGLKGASDNFKENGWNVTTVDINPKFNPDVAADINNLHIEGKFDLIWASVPCQDYSKCALPSSWRCNGGSHKLPDMRPFLNAVRIIRYLNPRWWVIENVCGAQPYFNLVLGARQKKVGSRYLWGVFPPFDTSPKYGKWKLSPTADRPEIRSKIPKGITRALRLACEAYL
jgi:hypothetical protein